jgi:hypothetical protein
MPEEQRDKNITDPNAKVDHSHDEVPINPRTRSSKELWAAMNQQCSIAAGFSGGPPERDLVTQNNDKPPSEVKRMKKATEEPKK